RRGGLGVVKEYEILDGEMSFTYRGERHFFAPQGAQGGGEGAKAHAVIRRADGQEEGIPSKRMTTLKQGDRAFIETAGGGGQGGTGTRNAGGRGGGNGRPKWGATVRGLTDAERP